MGGDDGAERLRGVKPGRHVGQDARETHVVLWIRLGRRGEVDVCPTTEPDAHTLVRTQGEWSQNELWRLDCNGLEEGLDVVEIVCDGGQRLGGGLLRLTWFRRLLVLCLYGDYAILVIVVVCPAGVSLLLLPLRDGSIKNIQELTHVRLPVEDHGLR